ncbi:MFS transporter [Actinosynnema sp. CS-041913]|uniref:MFS transporter n=1 Tax=Actinosynnema sp. CS-041913 TaxID=3239917 RepID=UPI003D8FAF9D
MDRFGPRPVMTCGSVLAVIALAGGAVAGSSPWFLAAWVVIGASMAATLYQPAFAALTRWHGERRVAALTQAPLTVTAAVAPWVATAVVGGLGGYPAVLVLLTAAGAGAAVVALWSIPGLRSDAEANSRAAG